VRGVRPAARLAGLLAAAGVAAAGAPAAAQQITSHGTFPGPPCEYCHRPHGAGPGPYGLRGDLPGSPPVQWLLTDAPGAGTSSATCLRCHWDDGHRRAQPDLASPALAWSGRYVGPQLTDDHFLGVLPAPATLRPYEYWRTGGGASPFAELTVVECNLCHVAHDASGQTPLPTEQYRFCGTCHGQQSGRVNEHRQITCRGCHKLHNSAPAGLFHGVSIEATCTRCHGPARRTLPDSLRYATVSGALLSVPEGHNFGSPCEGCHRVHGSN